MCASRFAEHALDVVDERAEFTLIEFRWPTMPKFNRCIDQARAPDRPAPDTSGVMMRKLIVSNLISLDGYASGPGGDVMALPFDTTFSHYNLELMQAADTLVSGATTYRGFVGYWPPVADDPAQPEVERAISRRHRGLEHLVVSNSLTAEETGPWREKTRIVRRDEDRRRSPRPRRARAAR